MSKEESKMKKWSKEDEKFAYNFLPSRETYHHHKEQMTYIGFLVQTAFLTAIMTFNWASSSSETTNVAPEWMLLLAVPFWLLIHVFLRWQLRLRRYAALQVAALQNALLKNLREGAEEATGNSANRSETRCRKRWLLVIDWFFWPCPSVLPSVDIPISEYPGWYQNEFKSQVNRGTGAFCGEKLVTVGSWLMLVIIIIRLTALS